MFHLPLFWLDNSTKSYCTSGPKFSPVRPSRSGKLIKMSRIKNGLSGISMLNRIVFLTQAKNNDSWRLFGNWRCQWFSIKQKIPFFLSRIVTSFSHVKKKEVTISCVENIKVCRNASFLPRFVNIYFWSIEMAIFAHAIDQLRNTDWMTCLPLFRGLSISRSHVRVYLSRAYLRLFLASRSSAPWPSVLHRPSWSLALTRRSQLALNRTKLYVILHSLFEYEVYCFSSKRKWKCMLVFCVWCYCKACSFVRKLASSD